MLLFPTDLLPQAFAAETAASVSVSVSMVKKQGYADELRMHRIGLGRTNNREDYAQLDDETYANFRAVNTSGMGTDTLFRSSSPIDPALNRNEEADEALLNALVRTVVNMADTREEMETHADYGLTNYAQCDIIPLGMGMDFCLAADGMNRPFCL